MIRTWFSVLNFTLPLRSYYTFSLTLTIMNQYWFFFHFYSNILPYKSCIWYRRQKMSLWYWFCSFKSTIIIFRDTNISVGCVLQEKYRTCVCVRACVCALVCACRSNGCIPYPRERGAVMNKVITFRPWFPGGDGWQVCPRWGSIVADYQISCLRDLWFNRYRRQC